MTTAKAKRWQFSLRGVLALIAMLSLPLIAWSWAVVARSPRLWLITMIAAFVTAGGVAGAILGWLARGTTKGLAAGYLAGAPLGLGFFYAILLWLGANLLK